MNQQSNTSIGCPRYPVVTVLSEVSVLQPGISMVPVILSFKMTVQCPDIHPQLDGAQSVRPIKTTQACYATEKLTIKFLHTRQTLEHSDKHKALCSQNSFKSADLSYTSTEPVNLVPLLMLRKHVKNIFCPHKKPHAERYDTTAENIVFIVSQGRDSHFYLG